MERYLTKAEREARGAERRRIHDRELALEAALQATGYDNPMLEPNGTHAALWRLAKHLGLVSEAEVDEARRVIGDLWSYTGD